MISSRSNLGIGSLSVRDPETEVAPYVHVLTPFLNGVDALAASRVGLNKRFLVYASNGENKVAINPCITW